MGTTTSTPPPAAAEPTAVETRPCSGLRLHLEEARVPAMAAGEYASLRASIDRRGVLTPLAVTAVGVIIDGRARWQAACELALKHVPVLVTEPLDQVEYMLRMALERRQLSASQRACLAIELDEHCEQQEQARERQQANLRQNTEVAALPPRGVKSRELAAARAGCSARVVQDAITVKAHDAKLFERIKRGELSAEIAARRVRRAHRDSQLDPAPPLPEGPFELIYADPPWQLGNPDGPFAPEQHYPTMALAEIKALQIPSAADALLYLWAVNSHLPEALEVLAGWGFQYRGNEVWVKQSIGPGVWTRQRHELLLIGRRGNASPPEPDLRLDSVIEAARRKHSQKPDCFYQRLEHLYPERTKLELFRRGKPRPGWAAWGNEVKP